MEHSELLYAGAAKGDITPRRELLPMPLLFVINFDRILDPLYVRVVALKKGEKQSLFIVLDMTLVPYADETLAFLEKQTGIPKEYIFLTATHTHGTTPVSMMEYSSAKARNKCKAWYEQVKKTLITTIHDAQSRMTPVRYGYGEGESYVNACRDVVVGSKAVLGNNFERPSDRTVRMLRLDDYEGKTVALIANYACHAVVLNGYLHGRSTAITGDLPGRTCAKLESEMDGAIVLWCSGASGDQNPRLMVQQFAGLDGKGKPIRKNLGEAALAVLDYLSDEHARDIRQANKRITCSEESAKLYAYEKRVNAESIKQSGEKVEFTLRLWMLGDIAFQGISAEIVTSVGKAVREASPYDRTILVSHTAGYHGYVPDDWEYEHHAFEVDNSRVKKGTALPAFLEGFRALFAENDKEKTK